MQNWNIILPKDLTLVIEAKRPENIGSWTKNGKPVEALAKPAQLARIPVDRLLLPGRGPV